MKDKVKTGDKGAFKFENVEPGAYIVSCKEDFRNRVGEIKADVPAKDKMELDVTVELFAK
jgi:hypothetical protein